MASFQLVPVLRSSTTPLLGGSFTAGSGYARGLGFYENELREVGEKRRKEHGV